MKRILTICLLAVLVIALSSCGVSKKNGITNNKKTDKIKTEFINEYGEKIYLIVDSMPEFPGGKDALRRYISENVIYPKEAAINKIQGRVYVQFIIDKDGSVARAKIVRGIDPYLNQEALRVVRALPNFKPGINKGETVRVSYTIPINFRLT